MRMRENYEFFDDASVDQDRDCDAENSGQN